MKFLSVCSGIEAASVAWHPIGWTPVAFSEVDPFPCAVLAHHYPNVPNFGDMTKYKEWPDAAFDVLVGGTPCQSFSVAGLRKGLDDPRGNLMLTFGAIARRYRPTWLAWENVPGVLSSNGGRDFGTFLGMLAELGYGFAYRVLDAQYFGVAQRRRRVFVVGCLGDWRRAAAVLFERDSLRGDSAPRRASGKDSSGSTGDGVARCLTTGEMKRQDWETCNFVAAPIPFDTTQVTSKTNRSNPQSGDPCHTLSSGANPPSIAEPIVFHPTQTPISSTDGSVHCMGTGNGSGGATVAVATPFAVRRLTAVECERLQGFPDNWTAIPWRGKPADKCPDGPRYKALGNSMAVPVMAWIGKRIQEVANGLA